MASAKAPHLVPSNLIGQRFPRNAFGNSKIALVGYCPPPSVLAKYHPVSSENQYFIHVSPDSVKMLSCQGVRYLSLAHVYGGPVSASTVEELAYYDFDYILAYGLAGGLGTRNLTMGDFYLVEKAFVADGTTPHYTRDPIVGGDRDLQAKILELSRNSELKNIVPVQAFTGDAIYREDEELLQRARDSGCDVVNLDSSRLFAAATINSEGKVMHAIQCGVISDVARTGAGQSWESSLAAMLSPGGSGGLNPLELTARIVEFYIERLGPALP